MRKSTSLESALSNDPIAEFERLSGKRWNENTDEDNKAMLGLAAIRNTQKHEIIKSSGDTTFSMSGEEYQANIEDFGFELIYEESFTATHLGSTKNDVLKVFWLDGLLLYFDTYGGSRNSGKVWYNWKRNEDAETGCTSSGTMEDDVWVGYHDCREALRFKIDRLRANGKILTKWKHCPSCLWITHYGEKDDVFGKHTWNSKPHPADVRTQERIDKFPEHVRSSILR